VKRRIDDVTKAPLRRGLRVFAALAVVAAISGCGGDEETTASPTAPAEDDVVAAVEGVEGGEITGADLEEEVLAEAEAVGDTPPVAGSPEFDLLAGDALDSLLIQRWIAAEAAEQGGPISAADAAALEDGIDSSGIDELQATWGPRTECETEVVSRLCGGGEAPGPPPDIPPASGLEEPPT
jgi:hypothetical protein